MQLKYLTRSIRPKSPCVLLLKIILLTIGAFIIYSLARSSCKRERHRMVELFSSHFSNLPQLYEPVKKSRLFGVRQLRSWISAEELAYPLAFGMIVYEDAYRAARFFNLIYRPHNAYCIHFDASSSPQLESDFMNLVFQMAPLANVVVVPKDLRIDVEWGEYSVLEVTLLCARLMLEHRQVNWKYFFNLNEKELPLRTNWELVTAVKAFNGANSIEGVEPAKWARRFPSVDFELNVSLKSNDERNVVSVTWIKGCYHVALRREFVDFMLHNPVAVTLQNLLADRHLGAFIQDETFFSTLAYNPHLGAPGACNHIRPPTESDNKSWHIARYVDWNLFSCRSGNVRNLICMLGVDDLPILLNRPEFFANKFLPSIEPIAYDFVENWIVQKVQREQSTLKLDTNFDPAYYSTLYCSRDHI